MGFSIENAGNQLDALTNPRVPLLDSQYIQASLVEKADMLAVTCPARRIKTIGRRVCVKMAKLFHAGSVGATEPKPLICYLARGNRWSAMKPPNDMDEPLGAVVSEE